MEADREPLAQQLSHDDKQLQQNQKEQESQPQESNEELDQESVAAGQSDFQGSIKKLQKKYDTLRYPSLPQQDIYVPPPATGYVPINDSEIELDTNSRRNLEQIYQEKNDVLKAKLDEIKKCLGTMIPEQEEIEIKAPNYKNQDLSNFEIREVVKFNEETGDEIKTSYIVHKVNAMRDTLFQISYQYKISKKEIQRINEFAGDDIYYMKELLIPIQEGFQQSYKLKQYDAEADERLRRETCVEMLDQSIRLFEQKFYNKKQQIMYGDKGNARNKSYKAEATYYLENNNYDFKASLAEYKGDLKSELEYSRLMKPQSLSVSGKKKASNKVGDDFEDGSSKKKKKSECNIF